MSQLTDKLANGTLWAGAGRVVAMICSFVVTLLLARALPPSDYGAYFVAVSTIVILTAVGTMGMDQVVVRFASACSGVTSLHALRRVMLVCLAITLIGSVIAAIILASVGEYFFSSTVPMPAILPVLWIVVAWLFFATLQLQLAESFRGVNDIRLATLFGGVRSNGIINSVLACFVIACLWELGLLNLETALLTALGTSVVVVTVASTQMHKLIRPCNNECETYQGDHHARFSVHTAMYEGWPLWFAVLLNVLNAMGSTWLAGAFDTPSHVALFGVAQRVILLLIAPMQIVNAVLPPMVAKFHAAQDMSSAGRLVRMAAGVVLLPSIIVFTIMFLVGRTLLVAVFGSYYAGSYLLFLVLGVGQLINLGTGAWQIVLPMTGSRKQMLAVSVFSVLIQTGIGIYLGSRFGVMGIAVAYAIAMVITNLVGMCAVRVSLGVWTFATFNRQSARILNGYVRVAFARVLARR